MVLLAGAVLFFRWLLVLAEIVMPSVRGNAKILLDLFPGGPLYSIGRKKREMLTFLDFEKK